MSSVTNESLAAAMAKATEQTIDILNRRIADVREAFDAVTSETENGAGMFTVGVKLKIEKTEGSKLNISSVVGWGIRFTEASGTAEMDPNQPDLFTELPDPNAGSGPGPDGDPGGDPAADAGITKKNGKRHRKGAAAAA